MTSFCLFVSPPEEGVSSYSYYVLWVLALSSGSERTDFPGPAQCHLQPRRAGVWGVEDSVGHCVCVTLGELRTHASPDTYVHPLCGRMDVSPCFPFYCYPLS